MDTILLWCGAAIGIIAALVGLGWLFHRVCTRLEEAGYLHYRKSEGSGGGGGALYELDKLTRPSIKHVIEAQDVIKDEENIDGD